MHEPYLLYGAQISYFTGKVRAYLRWKGLPFTEIAADARIYREVIVPGVGFPVIPVVRTPGGLLQDSTEILETLEALHPEPSMAPPGGVQRLAALLLELYADEWLVLPAMHYRWHHNRDWAMRAFGELSAPHVPPEEQLAIGQRLAAPFAQAAVLLGAQPHLQAAVERSYEALLQELDRHLRELPCLLGEQPCLADFALYGPLYAHQYRDPASGALMRRVAPSVAAWVERLRDGTAPAARAGAFPAGDVLPATMLPVLRRMMREQLPVLEASIARLLEWMRAHPGQVAVPRTLGMHAFGLEGCTGERIVRPYSLWMLQRARDAYRALDGAAKARADALLAEVGGERFAALDDPPRLARAGLSVALVT